MSDSIISVQDLRKVYRVGELDVAALRGANLEVPKGEFLAIVGPSGSGKSTLFYILGGLAKPTSGKVAVGGEDLASLTDSGRTRLRRSKVGFVFQRYNLLPTLTALGNIEIARYIAGHQTGPLDKSFLELLRLLRI